MIGKERISFGWWKHDTMFGSITKRSKGFNCHVQFIEGSGWCRFAKPRVILTGGELRRISQTMVGPLTSACSQPG